MSYCTLDVFLENGDAETVAEYPNNHRGAPFVWQALVEWYGIVLITRPTPTYVIFKDEKMNDLWALADDPKVKLAHRLALRMTLDWAIVAPGMLGPVADALKETALDIRHGYPKRSIFRDDPGDPGHLQDWARDLGIIAKIGTGLRGIGWHMCSATEDPWWVETCEDGDGRPYNLDADSRHHFVELT